MWDGEDAYVVGGGDSLRTFDWGLIEDGNVVRCNRVATKACSIVVFGDRPWWDNIGRDSTAKFGGLVVAGGAPVPVNDKPWLLSMKRSMQSKFATGGELVWGGNTGLPAINLALSLGAARVYLLGFDMQLGPTGRMNYHDARFEKANAQGLARFAKSIDRAAKSLDSVFPGAQVINVTDGSKLDAFPKVPIAEHFRSKEQKS